MSRLFYVVWAVVLCGLVSCTAADSPQPQVKIEQGVLRGTHGTTAKGRKYASFRGVPYASPPVGERRFQTPADPAPWQGVLNATQPGASCLQYKNTGRDAAVLGDEDCLFLNVYTPQLHQDGAGDAVYNVVVFIHGGAFMYGVSGLQHPTYLLHSDVVLVTLNYRLGLLGFLSTGDSVVPGNNGMKDQVAALRWVQHNIAAFGGNPRSVTIAGLSAGGSSVHYHFLSPLSRGLFHRGISLSGSALCQWAQADALPDKTFRLASMLGCPTSTSQALVDCLRGVPGRDIVALTRHFQFWMYNPFSPWAPTVEPASETAFLAERPETLLRAGTFMNVPWLVGITNSEGLYPAAEFVDDGGLLSDLEERWDAILPHLLDYNYTVSADQAQSVARRIREEYLGGEAVSRTRSAQLIQMVGDRHFVVEAERAARLHAWSSKAPVYFYQFSYRGQHSYSEFMSNTTNDYGACHGDDLAYVLQSPFKDTDKTEADRAMSKLLVSIWTSFVDKGVPLVGDTGMHWKPLTRGGEDLSYLHIQSSTDVRMRTSRDLGKRQFWDSLPLNQQNTMMHFIDEL